MENFEENHIVGDLKLPEDIDSFPTFSAGIKEFVAPQSLPLMDYCLPTDDQGKNPWCAAYAAAGFAESVLWRLRNYPEQMPPKWIYEYAKTIDGDRNSSGTTLVATLKALLWKGIFDERICSVKVIRNIEQIKFAIHKFGCCPVGFNISREWYRCNENKASICGEGDRTLIGGHAVLACGFMHDGLFVHNSWGDKWGKNGFAIMSWEEVRRQFIYGAVLNNCLNNMTM